MTEGKATKTDAETEATSSLVPTEKIPPTSATSSRESKLKLFTSLQNCSSRDVHKKLSEARGEELRERLVLELDPETHALWMKVKNRSAHQTHGQNKAILKILLESWVNAHEAKTKPPSKEGETENKESARRVLEKP